MLYNFKAKQEKNSRSTIGNVKITDDGKSLNVKIVPDNKSEAVTKENNRRYTVRFKEEIEPNVWLTVWLTVPNE